MRDSAIFRLDAISQGYRTSLPDYATYSQIQSGTLLLPAQLLTLFGLHFYSGDIRKNKVALKEKTKAATSKLVADTSPKYSLPHDGTSHFSLIIMVLT